MSLTTDPNSPCLQEKRPDGQQVCYLVLSEEERAKGFVRPVRYSYKHVGVRPKYPLRDLTEHEKEVYKDCGYVKFEAYPPERHPITGRFWTAAQLQSGCGSVTTMGLALSETWARNIHFYRSTYCCQCGTHFRVEEFCWIDHNGVPDGSRLGE